MYVLITGLYFVLRPSDILILCHMTLFIICILSVCMIVSHAVPATHLSALVDLKAVLLSSAANAKGVC